MTATSSHRRLQALERRQVARQLSASHCPFCPRSRVEYQRDGVPIDPPPRNPYSRWGAGPPVPEFCPACGRRVDVSTINYVSDWRDRRQPNG